MNEEIMIAEECSYYNKDNYPYCCEIWDNECEAQDCYYKQLKKAKKENKKLKEKLEKIKEFIMNCYYDDTVKCNWSDNLVVPNCEYLNECKYKPIDYLLHNIIEGAEDE